MNQSLIDLDPALEPQLSDTAGQWGASAGAGHEAGAPPRPRTVDKEWQLWLAAREERFKAFEEAEQRREAEFRARLQTEEAKPVKEEHEDVKLEEIQRALQELRTQNETLTKELEFVRSSTSPPDLLPQTTVGSEDVEVGWASLNAKVRTEKPKAWVGEYDHVTRETWIASAVYYLAGVGVKVTDRIDKYKTPLVFYHIRSLFSSEKPSGKTAALTWFDLQDKETPFQTVNEVFEAMRKYWADDYSAERALAKYRAAKQGVMRARDFASELSALANAAYSFEIGAADRRATYIAGLNPQVRDYVKTNLTLLEMALHKTASFEDVVRIAARTDDLEGFRKQSSGTGHTTSSRTVSNANSSSIPKQQAFSARSAEQWRERATAWQEKNPLSRRNEWFNAKSSTAPSPVRCYNCGEMGSHYSTGCLNSRKAPSQVVVAAVKAGVVSPSPSYASVAASAAPSAPSGQAMTVASSARASETGKAEGS